MVDIEALFKEKPYLNRMGANSISKRYNISVNAIKEYRHNKKGKVLKKKVTSGIRILIFDLETSPMIAYVWGRFKQNVYLPQTIAEPFIISWAAKWAGEPEVFSDIVTPKESLARDDKRIVASLWKLLDEADIVIAHNGKRFDVPKIKSRFVIHKMIPPSFYKQIDTLEIASRQFGFTSNKLDALAGYFDIEHKDDTDFNLWARCMSGDKDALDYMLEYNKKDVEILEKIYIRIRPWMPSHPNVGLYGGTNRLLCPTCGSDHLSEGKFYYTNRNKFKEYRCDDCGALSRGTKGLIANKTLSPIPK